MTLDELAAFNDGTVWLILRIPRVPTAIRRPFSILRHAGRTIGVRYSTRRHTYEITVA